MSTDYALKVLTVPLVTDAQGSCLLLEKISAIFEKRKHAFDDLCLKHLNITGQCNLWVEMSVRH